MLTILQYAYVALAFHEDIPARIHVYQAKNKTSTYFLISFQTKMILPQKYTLSTNVDISPDVSDLGFWFIF